MNSIEFNQENDAHMTKYYTDEIKIRVWFAAKDGSGCDVEVEVEPKSNFINH